MKETGECRDGKKLEGALLKVALGFSVEEVTEEFGEVDGELKLLKRKRTKKQVPPDLKAVQLLLAEKGVSVSELTDEELEEERQRLLQMLDKERGQVLNETKKVRGRSGNKKVATDKKVIKQES